MRGVAGWAGTWASLSVSREHCFPSAHFLLASLFWNLGVPLGQKLAMAGFWLSGDLPCGCHAALWAGLSPAWPLASVMRLPSVARWPVAPATGDHWKGGHPCLYPHQVHQVKLLWFGGHGVGMVGGMLKPVVNSAKINQPFKSCMLTRVYGQAGPFSCSPCSKSSRARSGLDGGKGSRNCVCVSFLIWIIENN